MKKLLFSTLVLVLAAAGAALAWYFIDPPKSQVINEPGSISGSISYPSDGIPPMRICAEDSAAVKDEKCIDVRPQYDATGHLASGSNNFHMTVTPGRYYVYATLIDPGELGLTDAGKAYYTQFVLCGMNYNCKDHAKIEIEVKPGRDVSDIVPDDWYQ